MVRATDERQQAAPDAWNGNLGVLCIVVAVRVEHVGVRAPNLLHPVDVVDRWRVSARARKLASGWRRSLTDDKVGSLGHLELGDELAVAASHRLAERHNAVDGGGADYLGQGRVETEQLANKLVKVWEGVELFTGGTLAFGGSSC